MMETEHFVQETLAELKRLHRAYVLADAMKATSNGALSAAQAAYRLFWADPTRLEAVGRLIWLADSSRPEIARRIRLIYRSAMDQQPLSG